MFTLFVHLQFLLITHYLLISSAFLNAPGSSISRQFRSRLSEQTDAEDESPFFFASVASDNNATATAVVGAAAVGGAVALSESTTLSTSAVISGGRVAATGGTIGAARTVAAGSTATGIVATASSSSSTSGVATATASTSFGRGVASSATALGFTSSRVSSTATVGAGVIASEIGSSSLEGTGIGAALDSSSTLSSAIAGSEELLVGDATTDAILAAGDSLGAGADSILFVAGEAGSAALSFVPGWLLSGGLAALASELLFALFALFVVLQAGNAAVSNAVTTGRTQKDANAVIRGELDDAIVEIAESNQVINEQINGIKNEEISDIAR
jgi:hypothetical protein